jgi:hypothetical protein
MFSSFESCDGPLKLRFRHDDRIVAERIDEARIFT